jgi:glycosyltransferase involved in cell wall biosynthesis
LTTTAEITNNQSNNLERFDLIPLVSIITPSYNHAKYIGECIESVLSQTYSNWELIIINDGSTDNTLEIAKKYAERDSRIHVIHQNNKGIFRLAETYNTALGISKGKYIAILEGDDYWEPKKLDLQIKVMDNDNSLIMGWGKAASRVEFQKENYQVHPVHAKRHLKYFTNDPPGNIFNAVFDNFFPPLTFIIRKDALLQIGGFIQVLPFPSVDLSTMLALCKLGKFYFFEQVLGTWRIFPNQTTKTLNLDILEGGNKIVVEYFNSLTVEQKKLLWFDEDFIWDNYKKRKIISFARSGRFKLIRKDYKGARNDFIQALQKHGFKEPKWKLRALIGLIFSFLHLDIETLARWFGKGSIK